MNHIIKHLSIIFGICMYAPNIYAATIPTATYYPDTKKYVVNDLSYYIIDEDEKTARVGGIYTDHSYLNEPYYIVEQFSYQNKVYTVTEVGSRAFYSKSAKIYLSSTITIVR